MTEHTVIGAPDPALQRPLNPPELECELPDPRPSDPIEALSWLGETEEDVVKALRERGIKGTPAEQNSCVLAQYLKVQGFDVKVDYTFAGELELDYERHNLPHLYRFVEAFDDERYPDLIDNG